MKAAHSAANGQNEMLKWARVHGSKNLIACVDEGLDWEHRAISEYADAEIRAVIERYGRHVFSAPLNTLEVRNNPEMWEVETLREMQSAFPHFEMSLMWANNAYPRDENPGSVVIHVVVPTPLGEATRDVALW